MSNRDWIIVASVVVFLISLLIMNALTQGWLGR